MPWWHLAVGAATAGGIMWLRWNDPGHTVAAAVRSLRLAMLPLALSAAFVLDDRADRTLAACPVPISLRRTLRVALVVPALAVAWIGLLAFAAAAPAFGPAETGADIGGGSAAEMSGFLLPVVALSVEFAGLAAVTLAAASLANRATDGTAAGIASPPITLAVSFGLWLLPEHHGFYVPYAPAPPQGRPPSAGWLAWMDAHWRWAALVALAAAAVAWASRDLGRRRALGTISTKATRVHDVICGDSGPRTVDDASPPEGIQ